VIAITQHAFGEPGVLEAEEVDRPRALPTEVLVRVKAVGVNPVDTIIRSGGFPLLGPPPFILGWDVSGIVEEVVPGTTRFTTGDEVYGMPFFPRAANAYAEYVAAPSRQLALKPQSLDHAHAAAMPMAGLTAWQSLVDVADVQPGQRVLIHGAAGGVGHVATQIAKHLGAYVIGTASAGKHDFVRSLGADELVDYQTVDFERAVGDVDVVLDSIGGAYADRSVRVLREGGLLVTLIERSNAELADNVRAQGRRFAGVSVEPDHVALERLAELVDAGHLEPHVELALPMRDAARAHEVLETTHLKGKVVLTA
jgi:NADPH:quinone reductase-like Zn-dependent oxidoreductase